MKPWWAALCLILGLPAQDVSLIRDLEPGADSSRPRFFQSGTRDRLVFFEATVAGQVGLWRTDGTPAGTVEIYSLPEYRPLGVFSAHTTTDSYFLAYDDDVKRRLYRLNAAANGLQQLGGDGFEAFLFAGIVGERAFVMRRTPADTYSLFVTDRSAPQGVRLVKENAASVGATLGNRLFFRSSDAAHGDEPWVSDGTEAGTHMLADVVPGAQGSQPGDFLAVDDGVYFTASSPEGSLWRTDGTATGTRRVSAVPAGRRPTDLIRVENRLYFSLIDANNNSVSRVWSCIGRAAVDLTSILQRNASTAGAVDLDGKLYFWARDDRFVFSPAELWCTEGTAITTNLLSPPNSAGTGHALARSGSHVYFAHHDAATGVEPWRTDGTPAGTFRLADTRPGAESGGAGQFTSFGHDRALFLAAGLAADTWALWITDGTVAGTRRLIDPAPTSSNIAFTRSFGIFALADHRGTELWRIDATGTSTPFAYGYSADLVPPELTMTDARIGRLLTGRLQTTRPGAVRGILLGVPEPPFRLGGNSFCFVRLPAPTLLSIGQGFAMQVPLLPGLVGVQVEAQGAVWPSPSSPLGVDVSNPVHVVVGNWN